MKRVYCLYRVSTTHQLREDDIPMQRQACREFAASRGWEIVQEFYEKGISGFKIPTRNRLVLQQIKEDAEKKMFDILLVFMFDRLGRRDQETPFFVEDLALLGIEIWSTKEGQQRFESHADKLINYIRYWQEHQDFGAYQDPHRPAYRGRLVHRRRMLLWIPTGEKRADQ